MSAPPWVSHHLDLLGLYETAQDTTMIMSSEPNTFPSWNPVRVDRDVSSGTTVFPQQVPLILRADFNARVCVDTAERQ